MFLGVLTPKAMYQFGGEHPLFDRQALQNKELEDGGVEIG